MKETLVMETGIGEFDQLYTIKATWLKDYNLDDILGHKANTTHYYTQYIYYMDRYGKRTLNEKLKELERLHSNEIREGYCKFEIIPIIQRTYEIE